MPFLVSFPRRGPSQPAVSANQRFVCFVRGCQNGPLQVLQQVLVEYTLFDSGVCKVIRMGSLYTSEGDPSIDRLVDSSSVFSFLQLYSGTTSLMLTPGKLSDLVDT